MNIHITRLGDAEYQEITGQHDTTVMVLHLYRTDIRDRTTNGYLMDERGGRICDTAEATPFMFPPGTYDITTSRKLFSPVNGVFALRCGQILVGKALVPGVVINTSDYYRPLKERLKKARQRRKVIKLVIHKSR